MYWELTAKFHTAILEKDVSAVKEILDVMFCPINVNKYFEHSKEYPINISVKSGCLPMVRLLIQYGANVNERNSDGFCPLHFACVFIHYDIAQFLIEKGAYLNEITHTGLAPLHMAVQTQSPRLVKLLVESGAWLDCKDRTYGDTPLNAACKLRNNEIVEYLINKGANVHIENFSKSSPLLSAIASNWTINVAMVRMLLKAGVNPNQVDSFGISPLIATIRRSSNHFGDGSETVQMMIDYGCDLNDREFRGQRPGETALNIAIDRNQDFIIEKLIRNGANVTEPNMRGETPLICLLRDKKYDLAKQVAACSPSFEKTVYSKIERYLTQEYHQNEDKSNVEQLIRFFFQTEKIFFPRLTHLCRCNIRKVLGHRADKFFSKLFYPELIKHFLNLTYL